MPPKVAGGSGGSAEQRGTHPCGLLLARSAAGLGRDGLARPDRASRTFGDAASLARPLQRTSGDQRRLPAGDRSLQRRARGAELRGLVEYRLLSSSSPQNRSSWSWRAWGGSTRRGSINAAGYGGEQDRRTRTRDRSRRRLVMAEAGVGAVILLAAAVLVTGARRWTGRSVQLRSSNRPRVWKTSSSLSWRLRVDRDTAGSPSSPQARVRPEPAPIDVSTSM